MAVKVVPTGLEAFANTNASVAETISEAGSADGAAHVAAAAAALGPVGAGYLAAYAPAQANNLAATMQVAAVHAAIGEATQTAKSSFIATDNG